MDDPKASDASLIKLGFLIAAVFIDTLSAPALRIFSISIIFLIPPPTVSGINTFSATIFTISERLLRSYKLATMS